MSSSFNRCILLGNLTKDPEFKYLAKGTALARLSLALNHSYRTEGGEKKEEVTFVEVTAFGRLAENVSQHTHKGSSLLVEGRLRLEQWEDKQTGQKRSKLGIVAESVQFLGSKQREPDKQSAPLLPQSPTSANEPRQPEEDSSIPF